MATSIFFNGRLISVPGSYSSIDASGLETIGLSASGIVAVIGTAIGGRPVSAINEIADIISITKPEQGLQTFKSGNLREAIAMLFSPSKDPDIQGGAQQVIAMKVNPSTQSSGQLSNAYNAILDLTAKDWGDFTNQINVLVSTGTTKGILFTITYEDIVETVDDLGGDIIFNLKYVKPTYGYDTMTAEVKNGGLVSCNGTRDLAGLDGDVTQLVGNDTLIVDSSSTADTTQSVVIYGLSAAGAYQTETLALNGTTDVNGTLTFSKVIGARVIGTTIGTVTITDTNPTAVLAIAPGLNGSKGLANCATNYVSNSKVTLVSDGSSTKDVLLIGKDSSSVFQAEKITLTGTTPVISAGSFSELNYIGLGDVEVAQTLTLSCEAAASTTTHNTIQKVADYFNSKSESSNGFVFTIVTALLSLDPSNLDITTGAGGSVSCLSPANPAFYSDAYLVEQWINNNSQLISASKVTSAVGGLPSTFTVPIYLTGGSEGTATTSDWQSAYNWLKQIFVNSIVPLTGDPAIHAIQDAHIAYMCGVGRKERDGFVGLLNTALDDLPTKTELKSQIVDLNSRHERAFAQSIEFYNTAGEREEFLPYFTACIAAGMQAGSSVGTPLTFKYVNVLKFQQSSTWNPVDDAEELIQSGLCFLENVSGVGRRWVRNITTHLSSNNLAYIEGSVNEAVNYAVYNFRTELEFAVGKKGFSGTLNAVNSVSRGILELLIRNGIIVAYRSLNSELITDVLEVSVELAPVLPINFVKTTIHLITIPQTA
jgi:hypothetical protein